MSGELMEIVPGERVGHFVLGMGVNDALAVLRHQFVPQRPRVRVIYALKQPLEKDIVLLVEDLGLQLRFEPSTQRLRMIDIFEVSRITLAYAGTIFGAQDAARSKFINLYKVFGPTYPGTLDSYNGLYFLRYTGICLMFPIPVEFQHLFHSESKELPLELPNGSSPLVHRLMIFAGNDERAPELVAKPRAQDMAMLRPEILLTTLGRTYLEEVRFHIGNAAQGLPTRIVFPQRNGELEIGSSLQDVIFELGEPSRVYFKQDKRMQIHAIENATPEGVSQHGGVAGSSGRRRASEGGKAAEAGHEHFLESKTSGTGTAGSEIADFHRPESPNLGGASAAAARMQRDAEACFEPTDYFLNYFGLGLDLLIDGRTHLVRKVIAHTNFPGHVAFSQYNKCDFRVIYSKQRDSAAAAATATAAAAAASAKKRESVIITSDMRFTDVQSLLGPCGRPMIHDSGVAANPFGASYLYAYQGCVFEFLHAMMDGHIEIPAVKKGFAPKARFCTKRSGTHKQAATAAAASRSGVASDREVLRSRELGVGSGDTSGTYKMVTMLSPGKRRRKRAVAATPQGGSKEDGLKFNESESETKSKSESESDDIITENELCKKETSQSAMPLATPTSFGTEAKSESERDGENAINTLASLRASVNADNVEERDAVLETLERKKDIFDQLWKGIAALQNGEGESATAWKSKLRELNEAKQSIAALKEDNESLRRDKNALGAERDRLASDAQTKGNQVEKLGAELAEHRESAQRIIRELEDSRKHVQAQYRELKQEEEKHRLVAEKRAVDLKEIRRQAELLGTDLKDKENQLAALEPARKQLEEKVALLQKQVESQNKSHEETTSHLAEISQENWALKDKVKDLENNVENADAASRAAKAKLTQVEEEHAQHAERSKALYDELAAKLKRTEERASESRTAAEEHSAKLEEHVKALQTQLTGAQEDTQATRSQLQDMEANMRAAKADADKQLESMRVAMRQVQDKHLQDVIRFDEQRKKLETELSNEEARVEALNKEMDSQKETLKKVEAVRNSEAREREAWTAGVEKEFEEKAKALLAEHAVEVNELKTKLAEAKAAIRNEAREAQRYKNTLAKAAKEEHDKLRKQAHKVRHELQQTISKLEASEKGRAEAQSLLKTSVAQRELAEREAASREQEAQRTLVELQHLITTKETGHAQDCDRLRAETEKQRAHVKALEVEKRDLLMDCKRLNDEMQDAVDSSEKSRKHADDLEEKNERLLAELQRARNELQTVEENAEKASESLQQEIDEHVSSRAAALAASEALRAELRKVQKEAAERVAAFSGKASKLEDELASLRDALKGKDEAFVAAESQAKGDKVRLAQIEAEREKLESAHAQELADLLAQADRAETEARQAKSIAEKAQARAENAEADLEAFRRSETTATAEVKRQTQTIQGLEKSKQEILERLTADQESMRLLKLELTRRKQDMAETQQELAAARAEVSDIDRRHQSREGRLLEELETLKTELHALRADKEQARKTENTLQAQLTSLRVSSDQSLKNYMQEAKDLEAERSHTIDTLRASLKEAENNLLDEKANFKRTSKHARAESERKAEEISRLQSALKAAQENGINVLQELEEKTAQYDSLTEDFERVGKSLQGLEKKLSAAEKARAALQGLLDEEKATVLELRAQLQNTESDVRAQLRQETEAHQATKKELTNVSQEKAWFESETNIKISALNRQVQNLDGELRRAKEVADAEKLKFEQEIREHEQFRESANRALSDLRSSQSKDDDSMRQQLDESRTTADEAANLCAQMEQERSELQRRLQEKSAELETAVANHEEAREEHERMVRNYRELVAVKRKLENHNKKLQLQLDTSSNTQATGSSASGRGALGAEDTSELVLKAEKEGYETAKSEYQTLVARMEREHSQELERLRQQLSRREPFVTSSRPVSPFSTTTSTISGRMTSADDSGSINGDEGVQMQSTRDGDDDDDDALFFASGPRAPSSASGSMSTDTAPDDNIMATAKFLRSRRTRSADLEGQLDVSVHVNETKASELSETSADATSLPPRAHSSSSSSSNGF
ncbi:UPF0183 protein CG7083 [Hondaea fermentalgiana]|uniref:UPF0183 protein CG7083 n=1 Tax=Hondaea fermentalgiana TaxID=2315210 RepID=A0A2R5GZX1_9STRA|nr:UPF0183 protein CG7083 [Hondaea fermentalgiana]|eukprot:GBG33604.1 UPF0183 protein CG7083 [Hondaea fermentalgiana]